jgi:hypothetical protein
MVSRLALFWRAMARCRALAIGLYLTLVLALFTLVAQAAGHLATTALRLVSAPAAPQPQTNGPQSIAPKVQRTAMNVPQTRTESSVTLTQGWFDWSGRDRSRDRWRNRDRDDEDRRRPWWDDEDDEDRDRDGRPWGGDGNTYRTVCVRLCDGYYWPISFATTPEHFARDRAKCESSCGSPAKLYRYRNPGGEPEDMEDINGQPYTKLRTAFLYRTRYEPSCKCKADPWDREALDRHRIYALEASKRKGDKVAAKELDDLKARRDEASRERVAESAKASATPAANNTAEAKPADEAGAEANPADAPSEKRTRRAGFSDEDRERMSLGARSAPSRSSERPMRTWRDRSDAQP